MKRYIIIILIVFIPVVLAAQPRRYYLNFDKQAVKSSEKLVKGEMGKVEGKNNTGPHIQKYSLAVYGYMSQGFPYCLAGQYWAINTACIQLNVINYLLRTAHCNTLFNYVMKTAQRDYDVDYKVNDLIIWRQNNGSSGHTERIRTIENWRLGIVTTYAFNTSLRAGESQNNGSGNTIKTRYLKHPLGKMFLRGFIGLDGK